jgi:hypothetical protein
VKDKGFMTSHTATLISAVLFTGSIVVALVVSPFFGIAAAIAAFLPDLLRLLGALRDVDEFQQEASGRAARLALVVGGCYMALMYAFTAQGAVDVASQKDAWLIAFTVVVAIRYIAYMAMFWNPITAAPRVFLAFGAFWAAFVVLSEWGAWGAMGIEAVAVVGPFVAGAALARRLPRTVGVAAIVLAVAAFIFFGLHRVFLGDLGAFVVLILIPAPLVAVGVGLLRKRREDVDAKDE